MDGTILSVVGVGVALAAIIVNGQRAIRAELASVRADLHTLGERVARIEGQLAGPPRFFGPPTRRDDEQAA